MRGFPFRWLGVLVVWATLLGSVPSLAGPREKLLQLVPEDVGFCLVVNNLRDHYQKLNAPPWNQFPRTFLGQAMRHSPEMAKLQRFEKELETHLEITWPQLRDEILGDCVVFAYQHNSPANPQEERGLALVWMPNPALVRKVVDNLNKAEEVQAVRDKQYAGVKYFHRQERKQQHYYLFSGSIFVFTSHEPTLRQVIDRIQAAPAKTSLTESFQKLPSKEALVTFWINPRAFDEDLNHQIEQAEGKEQAALQNLQHYWKALDAAAFSFSFDKHVAFQLSLQGRFQDLPKKARDFLQSPEGPGELWQRFPSSALFAVVGRTDFSNGVEMLKEFMSPEERAEFQMGLQKNIGSAFGRNFVEEVLPSIGPVWGMCVAPGPGISPVPDVFMAIQIQSRFENDTLPREILSVVRFVVRLAVYDHNRKNADQIRIQTIKQGNLEISTLQSFHFPPGFQPSLCLKDGYLVLTSSPQTLDRFQKGAKNPVAPPLARFSFRNLAVLLKNRQEPLLNYLDSQHLPRAMARPILVQVQHTLGLFDSLDLSQKHNGDQVTWTLRLTMADS